MTAPDPIEDATDVIEQSGVALSRSDCEVVARALAAADLLATTPEWGTLPPDGEPVVWADEAAARQMHALVPSHPVCMHYTGSTTWFLA